jgi:beta-galactosidase
MRRTFARFLSWVLFASAAIAAPAPGKIAAFDFGWLFRLGDFASAAVPAFDDSAWRTVDLPHDWSVEEPFRAEYGSGNGYAAGGIGWYRKHFRLEPADADKIISIEFEGIYDNSEVWINGHFVGRRPYGYSSFDYEMTPLLKFGEADNVVAVRVDHSRFADSRWYTGSGIYRHVRIRVSDKLRIAPRGVFISAPEAGEERAAVRVETLVENRSEQALAFELRAGIEDAPGRIVGTASKKESLGPGAKKAILQEIVLDRPGLWAPESPILYVLHSRLLADSTSVDEVETSFGIRSLSFDPDQGLILNGKGLKMKGVCLHHDAGALGAAVPEKVLERRLRLLKELGVNAVRTSHNPPAPELLVLCDRLGLLVQEEAFDEFTPGKNKWVSGWNAGLPSRFGYAEDFALWSVRDIRDMVLRDRNHPCVIMWSIGNEIDYPNDPFSHPVLGTGYKPENPQAANLVMWARPLVEAVKSLDPTRPVTAALAHIPMSDAVGLTGLLDLVGYNYQEPRYAEDHKAHPGRVIYGSENGHQLSAWAAVRDNPYVAGQFLWTGVDYLGEAGPWPNRASGFGLLDLCGFKKPLAWFRRSLWLDEPMIYLCAANPGAPGPGGAFPEEHWNWPEESRMRLICYTNCDSAEFILNGRKIAVKHSSEAVEGALELEIPYEPGVVMAVGRKHNKDVCEFSLRTAGPARRIELVPDSTQIAADGKDLTHLEFRIVDKDGVRVPDSASELTFAVEGPGRIIGIDNGDLNDVDNPKDRVHRAFKGRGLAYLQSLADQPGIIELKITSPGLEPAVVRIESRVLVPRA